MTSEEAPDLLELVRRAHEPIARRDIDALMSFYAPDAVWDLSAGGLGIFQGRSAIREFMEDWFGSYDRVEIDLEQILDLGGEVTLAIVVQDGRPIGTSSTVQLRYATVNKWANGLIERATNYLDTDEARAAAERLAEERG